MKQKIKSIDKKKDDPLKSFGKYPDFPLNPKLIEKIDGKEMED